MDFTAFFQILTSVLPFLPKVYHQVVIDIYSIITLFCWFFATVVSFFFSLNSARIWTSISVGFFLLFICQFWQLNPWYETINILVAIQHAAGAISVILISIGIYEYFLFTRTLEIADSKKTIYIGTAFIILTSILIIAMNPKPSLYVTRNIHLMSSTVWFYLCLINILTVIKIYTAMKGSPISKGILSFGLFFVFALVWKGTDLYLMIYQWDESWLDITKISSLSTDISLHSSRVKIADMILKTFNFLTGLSVAGSLAYLYRLLR